MRHVIFFFGSGLAWYVGVCLLLLAAMIPPGRRSWLAGRALTVGAVVGGVLLILSGTPQPWWMIGGVLFGLLIISSFTRWKPQAKTVPWLRRLANSLCLLLLAVELPWTWSAGRLPTPADPLHEIHVLGDSVSAGMGEREAVVWPVQLAELLKQEGRSIPIISHAQMGATVQSARKQALGLPETPCLVLVAIGGNDLLGPTTDAKFAEQLNALLSEICRPDRVVLMLELPLPPLRNAYGAIQRRLSQKYGVPMIPKRVMAGVLTGPDSTLDSIHLTTAGHARMAAAMKSYVDRVITSP
ncbi:MAG TPA: SGNH/GDSL hydrolase family protein [Planctomycetaceae bacterium]|nr:SGNH/GDSL hydrolase family protein [Planctomycetaceae bacterium]